MTRRKKRADLPPEVRAQVRAERKPQVRAERSILRAAGAVRRAETPAPRLQCAVKEGDLVQPRNLSVSAMGDPLVGIVLELTPRSALVLWSIGVSDWWSPTILRRVGEEDA